MAASWGKSWAAAWGNAWGAIARASKTAQGGGRVNVRFTPIHEVSLVAPLAKAARAGCIPPVARVADGILVQAPHPAVGGGLRVRVHRPTVALQPRVRCGSLSVRLFSNSTLSVSRPAPPRAGSSAATIRPRIQQLLVCAGAKRMAMGSTGPAVFSVTNPRDDEVLAIVSIMRQRRRRRLSSALYGRT